MQRPLSSEHGTYKTVSTYKTVKAILWPCLPVEALQIFEVVPSLLGSCIG